MSFQPTILPFGAPAGWWSMAGRRARPTGLSSASLAGVAAAAGLALTAYLTESVWLLWGSLAPAVWVALTSPARLVQLLLVTAPTFPVIRLTQDLAGAKQVSTKGAFFSADDPLVLALLLAATWRMLQRRRLPGDLFPGALVWLMILYPVVIAANLFRLETGQALVSSMYYVKWLEYAILVFVIPQVVASHEVAGLLGSIRKLVVTVLAASTVFAAYEFVESLRTGSYTASAGFPRASSFFGTLDPRRFGGSEDPVNYGVYAMVAGAIILGLGVSSRRRGLTPELAGVVGSVLSLLLSASRAPLLAAAAALVKIHRIRSSRILLGLMAMTLAASTSVVLLPEMWSAVSGRFGAIREWQDAGESSAVERLTTAVNSPVFQVDQYWILGHGHSSYRFIAEEHMSRTALTVSRSLYNFPLTVWYDAGVLGLLFWVLLFIQLNRRFLLIHRSSPSQELRGLSWGLRGALWGLAVAAMFGEVPYNWRVMGFFYTACGICLAADRFQGRQRILPWQWR